jgi:sugar/nucleoside kinase (ribokinase family)
MPTDIFVLNTAVADFRHDEFSFADRLAGEGGLALCSTEDMPGYSQTQYREWIKQGIATAGGPGNTAPLMAGAGLKIAVGVNLGRGDFDGLDAQGRFFHDVMTAAGIDMSATVIHPELPTGTTFIHRSNAGERLGIAYFPNANNDFDFEVFKPHIARLEPAVVYYMYCGLSTSGDANGGRDLAEFARWCRKRGSLFIADSHTLTGEVRQSIDSGEALEGYRILAPVLPELDIFFTSSDEACLIWNTLAAEARPGSKYPGHPSFLEELASRYFSGADRTRLIGVTTSDGAYEKHLLPDRTSSSPARIKSVFMSGDVIDLVGAGDAFRAGVLSYIARNLEAFRLGKIDFGEAIQLGNLFASLYIKAPLGDRYAVGDYEMMVECARSGRKP